MKYLKNNKKCNLLAFKNKNSVFLHQVRCVRMPNQIHVVEIQKYTATHYMDEMSVISYVLPAEELQCRRITTSR